MGSFLVVAGGLFQVPLIKAIKSRGFEVTVVDADPNAPGFEFADNYAILDIANQEDVVSYARQINPMAITSIVSEIAVTSVAAAADALRLPGIGIDTAKKCTDKFEMRSAFSASNLPSPKFLLINNFEEAELGVTEIGMPVVIKPVDSSGSRGVMRVDSIEDLESAYQAAKKSSRSQKVIMESFIEGQEFTVETITVGGVTTILGFSKKKRIPFPHCVSIELLYFDYLQHKYGQSIVRLVMGAINSVGLQNGTAHTEVILSNDGPVLVEMAARGGGYEIFTKILPEISGVNTIDAVIDLSLGLTPSVCTTRSRCAALKFFDSEKRGVIQSVSGIESVKNIEGVLSVEINHSILGTTFDGIKRDGERLGYMIALGDKVSEIIKIINQAEQSINFDITSN